MAKYKIGEQVYIFNDWRIITEIEEENSSNPTYFFEPSTDSDIDFCFETSIEYSRKESEE